MKDSIHKDVITSFKKTLELFGQANHPDIELIFPHCRVIRFEVGEYLHEADSYSNDVFYIHSGLARVFSIHTEAGKEFNKSFISENQFVTALQSPVNAVPSLYHIQALEPLVALVIAKDQLEKLYYQSIYWANVGRLNMEALAVRKEKREAQFLLDSAESRYQQFELDMPHLVDRVPLYHIASYLGITDVALSRIRRKRKA